MVTVQKVAQLYFNTNVDFLKDFPSGCPATSGRSKYDYFIIKNSC